MYPSLFKRGDQGVSSVKIREIENINFFTSLLISPRFFYLSKKLCKKIAVIYILFSERGIEKK